MLCYSQNIFPQNVVHFIITAVYFWLKGVMGFLKGQHGVGLIGVQKLLLYAFRSYFHFDLWNTDMIGAFSLSLHTRVEFISSNIFSLKNVLEK